MRTPNQLMHIFILPNSQVKCIYACASNNRICIGEVPEWVYTFWVCKPVIHPTTPHSHIVGLLMINLITVRRLLLCDVATWMWTGTLTLHNVLPSHVSFINSREQQLIWSCHKSCTILPIPPNMSQTQLLAQDLVQLISLHSGQWLIAYSITKAACEIIHKKNTSRKVVSFVHSWNQLNLNIAEWKNLR